MKDTLETALSGLAALLIVGVAMTAVVVVPPAHSPAQTNDAALAMPILA